tara:strand:- start:62716 stop:65166 length:2451 start_codon:yes stop_codon:yes gene_type:complete
MEVKNYFAFTKDSKQIPYCTAYLYYAGTNDLATGVKDKNGNPIDNPFTADANGLAQFTGPNGVYDLRFKSGVRDYRIRTSIVDTEALLEAAGQAGDSAEQAGSQADRSTTNADRSESAADAAAIAGYQFQNTADGLANTNGTGAINRYFTVPSAVNTAYVDRYRNDDGVATAAGSYPSRQIVEHVTSRVVEQNSDIAELRGNDKVSIDFAWAAHDENGQVALGIRHDGTVFLNLSEAAQKAIAQINEVAVDYDNNYQYALIDESSNIAFGVLRDGRIEMLRDNEIKTDAVHGDNVIYGIMDESERLAFALRGNGKVDLVRAEETITESIYDLDLVYGLLDQNGKVAFGINKKGELLGNFAAGTNLGDPVDPNTLAGPGNIFMARVLSSNLVEFLADGEGKILSYTQRTDIASTTAMFSALGPIEYIAATGQSLSVGGGATENASGEEVFTANPVFPHHNFMFNTGTRGVQSAVLNPATLVDFVPAYEVFNNNNHAETQGSGMMRALHAKHLVNMENFKTYVYRSHGRGGASISELSKGSGFEMYANGVKEVAKAVEIASKYGRELVLRAVTWTQGEQDRGVGTSRLDYYSALNKLVDDYQIDYAAILPEHNPTIHFIIDQLSSNSTGTFSDIPLAQYDLAKDRNDVHISTSKYFMSYSASGVHLDPKWYSILGEYQARAWRAQFLEGGWSPLQPVSVNRTDAVIDIVFSVPKPPLVIDTTTLPFIADNGFVFSDDSGATPPISSVEIISDGIIRITLSAVPSGPNMKLSYAGSGPGAGTEHSGAWGNIRDSETEVSQSDSAVVLYNWALIFEETII